MKYILTIIVLLSLTIFETAFAASYSQWLDPHNQARRQAGLPALKWDTNLANYAQRYANQRRYDCALIHSDGKYGENLFWAAGSGWGPTKAVQGWVSERTYYNRYTNDCYGEDCGHYTQIVWKDTKKVGCAMVTCYGGQGYVYVCEYDPPGNYYGEMPYY